MDFEIEQRTILLVKHGSHAYGLATPTSDLDLKGVCIEPRDYHFGFLKTFEQHEAMCSNGHPEDKVIYSLRKFMRLAADCNPNIIEVLHGADEDIIKMDEFGEWLRDIKDEFISKKAKFTFSGYAHAQLKRIKTHRAWLLNPLVAPPERKDYGLADKREISKSDLGAYQALEDRAAKEGSEITSLTDLPSNVVEQLANEKRYASAKMHWEQYNNWKKTRNPARAALEEKYGYDTKHGSHLLRLMRMCKEILEGKGVIVKRHDREELLGVKQGRVAYDPLIEEAERLEADCEALYLTSTLRKEPNRKYLDEQCIKMTEEYLRDFG
jgi:predicted nucleotidyltransferase